MKSEHMLRNILGIKMINFKEYFNLNDFFYCIIGFNVIMYLRKVVADSQLIFVWLQYVPTFSQVSSFWR